MKFTRLPRFAVAALASLGLVACGVNSVPTAEENAKAKWADVEAAFQERANLIPNLQEIVLSSAEQERGTLTEVIAAIQAHDSLDYSRQRALQHAARAEAALAVLPGNAATAALHGLAIHAVQRSH